jgi:hypothetical protein
LLGSIAGQHALLSISKASFIFTHNNLTVTAAKLPKSKQGPHSIKPGQDGWPLGPSNDFGSSITDRN